MLDKFPARLHIVLAREASKGLILRRGPSGWVRAILWHTDTDTFEPGQWLRGRIYGERTCLSPDGSLFLYFAAQRHKFRDGYLGTWTAISKPPYLTALALWPKGDTWGGGGIFIDNETVCLQHCGQAQPHPNHQAPDYLRVITSADQLTDLDHARLRQIHARDWQLVHRPADPADSHAYGRRSADPPVWHRAHPTDSQYYLAQRCYGYIPQNYPTPSLIEYAVGNHLTNTEKPLEAANWADWDQRGRLVYARDGQIFAQSPEHIANFMRPLADFNDQTFEHVPTPDWARAW